MRGKRYLEALGLYSYIAPTGKASPHVKQQFVKDLQDKVRSDVLVLLLWMTSMCVLGAKTKSHDHSDSWLGASWNITVMI